MKIKIPHGEIGHMCEGGCAGYAKGGRVPEQHMDAVARNREELGLPATQGGLSTLIGELPGIGLVKNLSERNDINERMANPKLLHNTAGKGLETNYTHGAPWDTFGKEADVQKMAEGGIAGIEGMFSNPDPEPAMMERGTAGVDDDTDPAIIPEDIKEFVKMAHKERQESRPDENWRIMPGEKPAAVNAPYKRDEEDMPHMAKGGVVPNDGLMDMLRDYAMTHGGLGAADDRESDIAMNIDPSTTTAKGYADGGVIDDGEGDGNHGEGTSTSGVTEDGPQPIDMASIPPPAAPLAPDVMQKAMAPEPDMPAPPVVPPPTDQTYMDRANKVLGLGPDQQAGLMKLLGQKQQNGQIGAGIAGIGDAIASGGTLGKVNPGGLAKSEDILANKTKEGIEGMQTIRGNQEKASEMADKLEARDPNSPLSKYAQKAYAGIGKKIGLDLSHAPASLIADVSGKGVEALNTEFQGQLKLMGVNLQKEQVEATKANQQAERREAETTREADAAKTLAGQGVVRKVLNQVTPSGRTAQRTLENQAQGVKSFNSVEEAEGAGLPVGTRVSIGGRMATIK